MHQPLSHILRVALLLMTGLPAKADEDSTRVKAFMQGYLKAMPSVSFVNPLDSIDGLLMLHHRMRTGIDLPKGFSARMEFRNRLLTGSQVTKTPGYADYLEQDDGLVDLSFVPMRADNYVWHINIDRLNLRWSNEKWDITAGRQRINWGLHAIWNPNDIFNAYNYLDFDYEERPGSDALRVQYSPKSMTTLEAAWRIGKNKYDHIAAGMYRFNAGGYDLQLLAGVMRKDVVVGTGWAGNAGNAGLKGEVTWFHPYAPEPGQTDDWSLTLGLDYTTRNNWFLQGSYLLLTSGSNEADIKTLQLLQTTDAKTLMPFRHTLMTMATKTVSPVLYAGATLMYAPGGNNYLIIFPSLTYQAGTNIDLSLFAQGVTGMASGYKSLGNAVYARIKWSF